MRRGAFSDPHRSDGAAFRRSATSFTRTSRSDMNTPARHEPPIEAYTDPQGVCRDFAHLAITFCRCLNIPARYCTGYVSDIGLPPPYAPMDFAAWMEVYLGGRWHTFDPRNNAPRIGRILIAYGRDAADVPLTHIFGPGDLRGFPSVDRRSDRPLKLGCVRPIKYGREAERAGKPGAYGSRSKGLRPSSPCHRSGSPDRPDRRMASGNRTPRGSPLSFCPSAGLSDHRF